MNLRPAQVAAVLIVGIIGVLIPGLQPQLLGALAVEGRLSAAAVGGLASVELLAMGIAAAAAGRLLSIDRLRANGTAALLVTGLCDVLTPHFGAGGIFTARIVAGLGEGVLIWLAIGLIVRAQRPERWSGIYLMLQTLAQFAFASALGVATANSFGGFTALGLITWCGLLAIRWLPTAYSSLSVDGDGSGRPSRRGLCALVGVMFYLAYIVSVWVFVEPLGLQLGVPPSAIRLVAPLSLAMQVLGAGMATLLAPRLPARLTIVLAGLANLGLVSLMAWPPSTALFIAATAAFGFLWLFVMPFQVPVVIAADPTRNAAVLIGGAQLVGSSLGPFIAGQLVGATDVLPVLPFGALCLVVGVIALVTAGRVRHYSKP